MGDGDGQPGACRGCGRACEGELCSDCSAGRPLVATDEQIHQRIDYIEKEIARGKRLGVALGNAEELLQGVRLMLGAGSREDALSLLNECCEFASERIIQHETLVAAIRRSRMRIKEADARGLDTSEASTILGMAEGALGSADYKAGIEYAQRSAEAAAKGRRKGEAVEAASWQKG